jgi:hypothetical protein
MPLPVKAGRPWLVLVSCSRFQRPSIFGLMPSPLTVLLMPWVWASLSDPSPSGAAVRVKNGFEFVLLIVKFSGHVSLHCGAELFVHKILPTSLVQPRTSSLEPGLLVTGRVRGKASHSVLNVHKVFTFQFARAVLSMWENNVGATHHRAMTATHDIHPELGLCVYRFDASLQVPSERPVHKAEFAVA